jgi:glutaredoxin
MSPVTVLVNRNCGHCVRAIETVQRLANRNGSPVAAVDLTAHGELARRLHLKHSPAVLFGDTLAYPGIPDQETFTALCRANN